MVADNAVTLHTFSSPDCTTISAWECGDHFHIGHDGLTPEARAATAACKAAHPFTRPRGRNRPRP